MPRFRRHIKINLALQGGGAHGAFTWGVLDRLLEEEHLSFGWVSGTSAGAVNAVALADGLAEGGREGARAKLRQVWEAVHKAGVPDLLRLNPFLFGLSNSNTFAQVASLLSPYDFNPLGFDPLRSLLAETIDFGRIRASSPVELAIAATEVATGRSRIFRRGEMTVEAVLASACLPTLHRTVEIDGVGYWDGGFSKNPDLITAAMESPVADTLLVQINPLVRREVPKGAREIAGTANRLTFNAPLLRDVEHILAVREALKGRFSARRGRQGALATHRFHMIEAGRYTASLSDDSKLKPDLGLFTYLHSAGRTQTHKWIAKHLKDVGRRETVDLAERFNGDAAQPFEEAGSEEAPAPVVSSRA
ncbi:patatin-like phospholipase family protein [Hyphomicrobium sp. LHD-15]|uniref:patatin-like phospholipase family protein n=1 Tax=Hyphomicrobium sp. LHD-15 TaxID=3072142 RepID=UPI0028104BA3|nr:patatin-like phospholipase family protein [Hyphomicrobium sp. LHD-15]MDQ8700794.1 patatin-like phospholipase family protein [Hyphomicrobium sp. LHD-15]